MFVMRENGELKVVNETVSQVIQNGNSKKRISTGKDGVVRILPPVSAAEIYAVEKERKARTILLMAIPKEHLRRFHGMDDAKEIWEAIRTRFGGNANSKKMQKAVLKQQFEAFTISSSEGLEKGYDRFQQLLSQLEAHGAEVSTEIQKHKFLLLRSLPYLSSSAGKKEQNQNCVADNGMDWCCTIGEKHTEMKKSQIMHHGNQLKYSEEFHIHYLETIPPKPQEEIDDSFEGSFRNPSEHSSESESESISVPNEMSASKTIITNEKVMSESKEVEPSCVTHVKTPRKQIKNQETHEVKRKNWNEMMGRELEKGNWGTAVKSQQVIIGGTLDQTPIMIDHHVKNMEDREDWDAIRAKLEANAELAKSVIAKDMSEEDFAKRMVDLVNQRKKYFAEERANAKRSKPITQSQLRIYMSNYLKNQGTWKLSQLKKLKFEEIKEEFDKLVKQVDTFVPMSLKATKAELKRFGSKHDKQYKEL
ncbi:hypothetical protein Tco_1545941 [Tanacetum coccineum]